MLQRINDCKGRCACFVDPMTGLVKHEYKKVKTSSRIPVGGEYTIERDDTVTVLKRINTEKMISNSYIVTG